MHMKIQMMNKTHKYINNVVYIYISYSQNQPHSQNNQQANYKSNSNREMYIEIQVQTKATVYYFFSFLERFFGFGCAPSPLSIELSSLGSSLPTFFRFFDTLFFFASSFSNFLLALSACGIARAASWGFSSKRERERNVPTDEHQELPHQHVSGHLSFSTSL